MQTDEDMIDYKNDQSARQSNQVPGGFIRQKSKFWLENGGVSRHKNVEQMSKAPRRSILLAGRQMDTVNLNDEDNEGEDNNTD
jgi:hypothetical protein